MSEELVSDDPFNKNRKTQKQIKTITLHNEDEIIRLMAKENNFVSAPKVRKAEIRKQIFLYDEDETALITLQRYAQDRAGVKISQGEIIRTAIRMFSDIDLEERVDLVKLHKEEEGL